MPDLPRTLNCRPQIMGTRKESSYRLPRGHGDGSSKRPFPRKSVSQIFPTRLYRISFVPYDLLTPGKVGKIRPTRLQSSVPHQSHPPIAREPRKKILRKDQNRSALKDRSRHQATRRDKANGLMTLGNLLLVETDKARSKRYP